MFITQREGFADISVIAGELWSSGSGNSFDEFVSFVEDGLAEGREPDILALQVMNSGPSGRALPIIDRLDIEGPNRATLFVHESDRRDGFMAISGVIDFNASRAENTEAFLVWALVDEQNASIIVDLIDSMQMDLDWNS